MASPKKQKYWFKFEPDKWLGDYKLRSCSLEAKGMLIELMCIAFPDGYIANSEEDLKNIRRTLGVYPQKFERILKELLKENRIMIDEKIGAFYIPKMVRDCEKSQAGKDASKKRWGKDPLGDPLQNDMQDLILEYNRDRDRDIIDKGKSGGNNFFTDFEKIAGAIRGADFADVAKVLEMVDSKDQFKFLEKCKEARDKFAEKGGARGPLALANAGWQLSQAIDKKEKRFTF